MELFTEQNGVKFGMLARRDRAQMAKALIEERRRQIEANLKSSGAAGEKVFDRLDEFDENRFVIGEQLFNQFIVTDEGIDEVLLRSLRKSNPGAAAEDVDRLNLSDEEALTLVLKCCGRHIKSKGDFQQQATAPVEQKPDPTFPDSSVASVPTT